MSSFVVVPEDVFAAIPVEHVRDALRQGTRTGTLAAGPVGAGEEWRAVLACRPACFDAYTAMARAVIQHALRALGCAMLPAGLRVFLLLAPSPDFDKRLPADPDTDPLGPEHVNSGVTVFPDSRPSLLVVYREHEWVKVLLHELVHALGADLVPHANANGTTRGDSAGDREALRIVRDPGLLHGAQDHWGADATERLAGAIGRATDQELLTCINESFTESLARRLHADFVRAQEGSRAWKRVPPTPPARVLLPRSSEPMRTPAIGYVFLAALGDKGRRRRNGRTVELDDHAQPFQMDSVWVDGRGVRW